MVKFFSQKNTLSEHAASILTSELSFLTEITFAVRLWDGTNWKSSPVGDTEFTLIVNHPWSLRRIMWEPNELTLGEAFTFGDFDIEGDIYAAFRVADRISLKKWGYLKKLRYLRYFFSLLREDNSSPEDRSAHLRGNQHSRKRDRQAIHYHYDVGNEFYRLWLDDRMVYSCGYFLSCDDDIHSAQIQKLDYICRKLRLKSNDRLLDIGCGWGALIIHAAQKYGVEGLGITLSQPQADFANERIKKAGLVDQCRVEVCDYRDLKQLASFDKLVSVGMMEHVGRAKLPEYFAHTWELLRPGGTFLNHAISKRLKDVSPKGPSFIQRYVFPDSELIPICDVIGAAEKIGYEIRDLESMRDHYVLTLKKWVQRLGEEKDRAIALTDEATYRIWRIYMAGSAHYFETGMLNIYQALLVKPDRGRVYLPMTRDDWYDASPPSPRT